MTPLDKMKYNDKHTRSKIYVLRSNETNKYYIGSTYQILSKRYYEHKQLFNNYHRTEKYNSVFEILQFDDAYIEILEECPGLNRHLLFKKVNEFKRNLKHELVNGSKDKDISFEHKNTLVAISKERDKQNDQKKEKHVCDCGAEFTFKSRPSHLKTIKHQTFVNEQSESA